MRRRRDDPATRRGAPLHVAVGAAILAIALVAAMGALRRGSDTDPGAGPPTTGRVLDQAVPRPVLTGPGTFVPLTTAPTGSVDADTGTRSDTSASGSPPSTTDPGTAPDAGATGSRDPVAGGSRRVVELVGGADLYERTASVLAALDGDDVRMDARPGRRAGDIADILRALPDDADVVVIQLDPAEPAATSELVVLLDEIAAAARARCVVWILLARDDSAALDDAVIASVRGRLSHSAIAGPVDPSLLDEQLTAACP